MSIFTDLADFCGGATVTRDIELKNGVTKKFYFKELTANETEDLFIGVDADVKKNKRLRNKILALTVVDEDGKHMTEELAGKLTNDVANKLQEAALDVNGFGKKAEAEAKNA